MKNKAPLQLRGMCLCPLQSIGRVNLLYYAFGVFGKPVKSMNVITSILLPKSCSYYSPQIFTFASCHILTLEIV
uniref:Uncharacterized protein n=1 Tax=Oryza brachyantha TaxID=4533 RepID=J3MH34_ORYBR